MNILYIWDGDYPWDIRVEKICESLAKHGHSVHIAARNLKKNCEYEYYNDLHLHRLKAFKSDKVNYFLSFPAFFNPMWGKFLSSVIQDNNINMIIVRDLPMTIAGIWQGEKFNIPVIFDMAEDYVSLVRDIWRIRKFKGFNMLVRNPYLAKMVEQYAFKRINHVLVVIDEAIKVVNINGKQLDNITVVSNTPSLDILNKSSKQDDNVPEQIRDKFSMIYTGGIQLGRGIQLVIEALNDIVKIIPDFQFVVVGDGYAKKQLERMAIEKGVNEYISWVGWLDHKHMLEYIRASKIGIIPHHTSDHVNTTIPNKIFDYMACGLPVIASDSLPMKRIVDEEKCGATFKSGNVNDLITAIKTVYYSNDDYASNGLSSIKNKYNWELDEQRLLYVVNKLSEN